MNILVAGGTGLVGRIIIPKLIHSSHSVTVLIRYEQAENMPTGVCTQHYDPFDYRKWDFDLGCFDVVINLAGLSIFRRWTRKTKAEIINSRVATTSNIVTALLVGAKPEVRLINISGVGYYGHHGDETLDENQPAGRDFLARLAFDWETAAREAIKGDIRVVIGRLGNVFSNIEGVFPRLARLTRYHLGCRWGDGTAWMSWIHEHDLGEAIRFLVDHPEINGTLNLCAPSAIRNDDLMVLLSDCLGVKPWVSHLPAGLLKLAAGEFASVFLTGQNVVPRRLLEAGFAFSYPAMENALEQLLGCPDTTR